MKANHPESHHLIKTSNFVLVAGIVPTESPPVSLE